MADETVRGQSVEPSMQDQLSRPKFRLYSTAESVAAGGASLLAIVETTCAMSVYAWIALKRGTTHLTIAACVAPFLLLRTDDSTKMGLKLTRSYFPSGAPPAGTEWLGVPGII